MESEWVGIFCALIPKAMAKKALEQDSWDLHVGDGSPGISTRYRSGKPYDTYHRYGDNSGVEPLILRRSFAGVRGPDVELSEGVRPPIDVAETGLAAQLMENAPFIQLETWDLRGSGFAA